VIVIDSKDIIRGSFGVVSIKQSAFTLHTIIPAVKYRNIICNKLCVVLSCTVTTRLFEFVWKIYFV